jgi:hypothetical protein
LSFGIRIFYCSVCQSQHLAAFWHELVRLIFVAA